MKLKNILILAGVFVSINSYSDLYEFPNDSNVIRTRLNSSKLEKFFALLEISRDEAPAHVVALRQNPEGHRKIQEAFPQDNSFLMMPKLLGKRMTEEDVLGLIKEAYGALASVDTSLVLTLNCPYNEDPEHHLSWILSAATKVEN